MSIYIRGVEMPTEHPLWIVVSADGTVQYNHFNEWKTAEEKAVQVPPHGALVERDVITDAIDKTDWYHQAPNKEMVHGANSAEDQAWYKAQDIYSVIDNAPTVIPASGDGLCKSRKLSHADKIRTKNDYDLADWLAQIIDCCWNAGRCGECDEDCPMYNCCNNQSNDNIEDWLKQEAQE